MTQPGRPAVFIHGLWLHASSWGPWLELFQEAGYAPTAPGWPGDPDTVEESRRDPTQHDESKDRQDAPEQNRARLRISSPHPDERRRTDENGCDS